LRSWAQSCSRADPRRLRIIPRNRISRIMCHRLRGTRRNSSFPDRLRDWERCA